MLRVAITGFCAIALLSGCGKTERQFVAGPPEPTMPCNGNGVYTGKWPAVVANVKGQKLHFHADGRCKFTDLQFDAPNGFPPGFSNRVVDPSDNSISYTYDGKQIPDPGYTFYYENDYPQDGNGSGVIKNTTN